MNGRPCVQGIGIHHAEVMAPITEGQKDDVAAVQKTLFRVKMFTGHKSSGRWHGSIPTHHHETYFSRALEKPSPSSLSYNANVSKRPPAQK